MPLTCVSGPPTFSYPLWKVAWLKRVPGSEDRLVVPPPAHASPFIPCNRGAPSRSFVVLSATTKAVPLGGNLLAFPFRRIATCEITLLRGPLPCHLLPVNFDYAWPVTKLSQRVPQPVTVSAKAYSRELYSLITSMIPLIPLCISLLSHKQSVVLLYYVHLCTSWPPRLTCLNIRRNGSGWQTLGACFPLAITCPLPSVVISCTVSQETPQSSCRQAGRKDYTPLAKLGGLLEQEIQWLGCRMIKTTDSTKQN